MKSAAFQPETFQYFVNTEVFYVTGIIVETINKSRSLILKRQNECQLFFKSTVAPIDITDKLLSGQILQVTISDYFRECFIKGRKILRATAIGFDEDNIRGNL